MLATLSDAAGDSQRYPVVAWHRYGTGKCLSLATDRLWRLRFKTGDKYHWRVWSQCIQFLTLSRLMGEHKRIRLETDRSTYRDGEQARLFRAAPGTLVPRGMLMVWYSSKRRASSTTRSLRISRKRFTTPIT